VAVAQVPRRRAAVIHDAIVALRRSDQPRILRRVEEALAVARDIIETPPQQLLELGDDGVLALGVAAADDWDQPMRIKTVVPARPDSYERVFRQTGIARSLTDLTMARNRDVRGVLGAQRLERAIGVVYRPESELASHYFEAVLPEQFDAYVWFEETKAVTPLPSKPPTGVPETYPFGV